MTNLIPGILIAVIVGGAVFVYASRYLLYVLVLRLVGRAPGCPWRSIFVLPRYRRKRYRLACEILGESHILERDTAEGMCLWQTRCGAYWVPDRPLSGSSLADMLSEELLDQYGGAEHGVRPGDTVLDCGANVGVFTRLALRSGAKCVLAVEPSPTNAVALRRNLASEIEAGLVVVFEGGVWNSETVLTMNMGDSPASDSVLPIVGEHRRVGEAVPVLPIDALVQQFGLPAVDFIKMDIEGAEREALEGARQTIQRFRPRLAISVYHLPDDPACIRQFIASLPVSYRLFCEHSLLRFEGYFHSTVQPEIYFFEP